MKLEYFFVAIGISIDRESNNLSAFEILEEIQTERFPALLPKLSAVSVWLLESADLGQDYQVQLVVSRPGSPPKEFAQNFSSTSRRHRLIAHFSPMIFDAAGDWTFELKRNGTHIASHTITVVGTAAVASI